MEPRKPFDRVENARMGWDRPHRLVTVPAAVGRVRHIERPQQDVCDEPRLVRATVLVDPREPLAGPGSEAPALLVVAFMSVKRRGERSKCRANGRRDRHTPFVLIADPLIEDALGLGRAGYRWRRRLDGVIGIEVLQRLARRPTPVQALTQSGLDKPL